MEVGEATLHHPDHLTAQLVKQRGHDGTSVGKSHLTGGEEESFEPKKKKKKTTSPSTDRRTRRKTRKTASCVGMCASDRFMAKKFRIFF